VVRFREAEAAYHASLDVELTEHSFTVPGMGIRARYLEVGSGPTVLMVHGGGALGSAWTPLVPHLPGYRLVIPDRPGFGLSELIDYRGVNLESHAIDFLSSVLDAAGAESAMIVANSMGGLWSLWLAQAAPERVDRIALLGTPARLLETSAPGGMRLLGIPGLNRLMMRLEPPSPKQVQTLWRRMGHDPRHVSSPQMTELVVRAGQLPTFVPAWLSLMENVLPYARINPAVGFDESDLAGLTQPVLYIWGSGDPFGSLDVARRAQEATPGSRLEVIGVGHLPWLDEPSACGKSIVDFFGGAD
jgi:pimeloyl-ACP methyl ester carboxylesterase